MIHTAYRSRWSVGGKYTNKQTENRTMKLLKKVIYGLRKKKNQKAAPIKEIMRFFFSEKRQFASQSSSFMRSGFSGTQSMP